MVEKEGLAVLTAHVAPFGFPFGILGGFFFKPVTFSRLRFL